MGSLPIRPCTRCWGANSSRPVGTLEGGWQNNRPSPLHPEFRFVENIREELGSGALQPLPLVEGAERYVTLYLVYADRETAGPGVRRLTEIIRQKVAETCHRPPLARNVAAD
jgi:hypothetical protein